MKWAAAIAGVALWAAISVTGAQAGTAIGNGSYSCGEWTKDQKDNKYSELANEAWLDGFLSGYSAYAHDEIDVIKGLDPGARFGWVSNSVVSG
jgi:hypothetical protein